MNRKYHWTKKKLEFLKENYFSMEGRELEAIIGFPTHVIYNKANSIGLRKGKPVYSKEESDAVRRLYKTTSYKEIGELIGRSADSVKHFCQTRKLKRTAKDQSFLKEKYARATMFKKGNEPYNTKSDGELSIRSKKTGDREETYVFIRISKGVWELYHRYLWEQKHGKIPEGMMVAFKNGNVLDCRIENLELITMAENLRRNSMWESLNFSDKFVSMSLAGGPNSKGWRERAKDYQENYPELIELKKNQLLLNQTIKHHGESSSN